MKSQKKWKVLGIICARSGSTLKDKNILPLCGRPVIEYSARAAQSAKTLTRVVLSTNCPKIRQKGREAGLYAPFLRPSTLATPTARIEGALLHALEWIEDEEEEEEEDRYDIVVLLQNTAPLREPSDIDSCVQILQNRWNELDGAATVSLVDHAHPLKLYLHDIDTSQLMPYHEKTEIYRRQDLPPVFVMNGLAYAVKASYLKKYGRVVPDRVAPVITDAVRGLDIHNEWDVILAEALIREKQNISDTSKTWSQATEAEVYNRHFLEK